MQEVASAPSLDAKVASKIYTAPAGSGEVELGRTLVSLLDEACEKNANPKAFNQLTEQSWQAFSTTQFREKAEYLALGLLSLGLSKGDRVAFFTHSDVSFCLGDMACLIAGLVNVPIYLTHTEGAIKHILTETEASVIFVSDRDLLANLGPVLKEVSTLKTVIMWEKPSEDVVPDGMTLTSFEKIEQKGQSLSDKNAMTSLKAAISPQDLATIIYTSGTTGLPKGVMLTHENISSNVISAITGLTEFKRGPGAEVALSFLPLTHIFARTLQYAFMWYGASIYYSDPDSIREHFKVVKPTFFASVPRVLEKAYERILATGGSLTGIKKTLFDWSLALAKRFDVENDPTGFYAWQLGIANKLVLSKWREALGGDIRQIIVGGAALRADLVTVFGAADINIIQGYGLTETSPVIAFNRPHLNKPGTVGPVVAGTEAMISAEGEILSRGPHIMKGYYKNPEKTAEVLDSDGWFHTGDLGEFTEEGYLKITGRLKNLFKLSTGKYVMPQPLEEILEGQPLIDTALVVGEGEKYCAALLFVNQEVLSTLIEGSVSLQTLEQAEVKAQFKEIIKTANKDLPHWSNIKKIALILETLSIENGLLTPKLSVKRKPVLERFVDYSKRMYGEDVPLDKGIIIDV